MSLLSSILLGLIQGLAEFLPISSSGHLAIAEHFLGQAGVPATPDFFDVLLHLGTLVAVFVAYWKDIREMIVELIDGVRDLAHGTTPTPMPPARRLILLIIVATVPLFAVLPIKDWIEGLSDNIYFVAGALIVTGFLLFASDRVKKGQPLCLIEAMKMMSEVPAPCDCVIESVCKSNGELVAFGEPLFRYKPC